jgi:hypothetical protein
MVDTTTTKDSSNAALPDTGEAGAPEIEITPAMIEAGLAFLERRGLNSLTTQTLYSDFVIDFYRAVALACDAEA